MSSRFVCWLPESGVADDSVVEVDGASSLVAGAVGCGGNGCVVWSSSLLAIGSSGGAGSLDDLEVPCPGAGDELLGR